MERTQKTFSAIDTHFRWTDDEWYEWDPTAAAVAARKARDDAAKALKAKGWTVKKFSLGWQQLRRGGIGTGRPEIDFEAKVYGFNASRGEVAA